MSWSLSSTVPRASMRAISVSNARPPSSIGRPSASSSRRWRTTLNRPNSIVAGTSGSPGMLSDCSAALQRFSDFRMNASALLGYAITANEALVDDVEPERRKLSHRSTNRVEKSFCGDEIGGFEPLGEAAVDRPQQLARLGRSLLSAPEPSEAHSGTQLPGESALASRHVECLTEACLSSLGSGRSSPQEKQLALRAEQLCNAPSRFRLLRVCERRIGHRQPLGNLPGTAETRGQLGQKQTHVVMKAGRGQSLEGRLEQLRARETLPSLDEHDPLEALRPNVPHLYRVPRGEFERQSHVVVGGCEITDIQRDRTRRDAQRVQTREHVLLRAGIIDEILRESLCLIAKSLQPENARVVAIEEHSLVVLIEDDVRRPSRRDARANQRLEVPSRTRLVSQNVQRKADESVADRHMVTIGCLGGDGAELLGEAEGIAIVARAEAMAVESVYRSQPVPGV